jgi:hypothetical protein
MGKYIQGPAKGKVKMLMDKYAATMIPQSSAEMAFNMGKGVVCVVDNGPFEAAAYGYSLREIEAFSDPRDLRYKTWLMLDKTKAEELAQ